MEVPSKGCPELVSTAHVPPDPAGMGVSKGSGTGLGLLHAVGRGKRLILQHATAHINIMAEARQQAARAIQVRAIRHVLHMEARGRAHVAATSLALHSLLINSIAQRKALVLEDALHRRMYGGAAHQDLAHLLSTKDPPPPPACRLQNSPSHWSTPYR